MKEEILNILNMKDIISKYGIKMNRYMCNCPFHKDNSPSMKIYDKTFYCFSCNRTGDLISFVQQLYNLNFQEAMEKINTDFGLGLQTRGRLDKNRLKELEKERQLLLEKERQAKIVFNKKMIEMSKLYYVHNKIKNKLQNELNFGNWEDNTLGIIYLDKEIQKLDDYMEELYIKREF